LLSHHHKSILNLPTTSFLFCLLFPLLLGQLQFSQTSSKLSVERLCLRRMMNCNCVLFSRRSSG
jgi:hypothetical protein